MRKPDTPIIGRQNQERSMSVVWKTYRAGPDERAWERAPYNVRAEDGQQ
jgi:hypothetical protein